MYNSLFNYFFVKKIPPKLLDNFTKQLAILLEAGLSLVESLKLIRNSAKQSAFKTLLNFMLAQLYNGQSFASVLALKPMYFNKLYQNLIAAGEQSGTLALMLHQLADYQQHANHLKQQIQRAWFYPSVVITIAIIVTIIILEWVIPQFEVLLSTSGAQLPYLTKLVIALAHGIKKQILLLLSIAIGAGFTMVYLYQHTHRIKYLGDRLILQLPWLGNLLKQVIVARFSRILRVLILSGIPLIKALRITAGTLINTIYIDAIDHTITELNTGKTLALALTPRLFSDQVLYMIMLGESSSTLETMLGKIAEWYEIEIANTLYKFSILLEPVTMTILGSIIGGLIVAMYLPIFQMGNAIN